MKKPTPTTILLTTLLTASVLGNAYQYKATDPAQETTITQQAVSDDPDGETIFNPIRGEAEKEAVIWSTTATFAITYAVKVKAGPGGATVTTYYTDTSPRNIKQKTKPTGKDITWQPPFSGQPGIVSIEVVEVKARAFKPNG